MLKIYRNPNQNVERVVTDNATQTSFHFENECRHQSIQPQSPWKHAQQILPPIREEMNGVSDDSDDDDSNFISWGYGEFGQHGHGTQEDIDIGDGIMEQFSQKENKQVKMAACGASHVIVVTNNNQIYGWGNGNSGQLGTNSTETSWQPKQIHLLDNQRPNPPIAGVACGGRHTMVWLTNGNVFSFGNNFFAQLGYDFKQENYKENQKLKLPPLGDISPYEQRYSPLGDISPYERSSPLGYINPYEPRCSRPDQTTPQLLKFLVYRPVAQVSCGEKHSVFRFQGGSIACVGCNTYGQIGSDNREEAVVPRFLDLEEQIKYITSGANHNLAITVDGQVYQWGYGKSCGDKNKHLLSPTLVEKLKNVVCVEGGAQHGMALTASGSVYVWGSGSDGQLGLGDKILFQATPKRLKDSNLKKITYIAAGESYSAAITEHGKLYMWGKNSHCILPNQPTSYKIWTPLCINTGLRTVKTISCGSWHAVALTGIPDPVFTSEGKSEISDLEEFRMVDVNGRNKHKDEDETSEESEDDFREKLPNIAPKQTALDGEVLLSVTIDYPEEILQKRTGKRASLTSEQLWQQTVEEKLDTDKSRLVIQVPSEAKPHFIDASTSPIPFSSSESESDGGLHSSRKSEHLDEELLHKPSNTPSQKSVSRYPLFFDRQKTNALKEQPSSVVQFSKTNAENFILPRENTNFSCKQIDLTELEIIKTIHDLKSQEKIVRANLINETGQTFIDSPITKLSADNKFREKLFTRSSEKSVPNLDNGRYVDSPVQKSGRHSDTSILNMTMRDRLSVTKSHRSIESALADYYSIDDGRWPQKQSNSIPKKGDVDFGLKISRSDTIIGPVRSPSKHPLTSQIQRYSNVHNPLNSQKSIENKTKVRIHVPRQVSIPVRGDKPKVNNLRVDGLTRKRLMFSSATSWRDRGLSKEIEKSKNGSDNISDQQKLGELNGNGVSKKLLNGHTAKSHNIHSSHKLLMKRKHKTHLDTTFNLEHYDTAMEFDNDSQHILDSEHNGHTSVSQMG